MFETIVVPLDGSQLAEAVLPGVSDLARKLGSKVLLVQAVETLAQRLVAPPDVLESPAAAAANITALEQAIAGEKEAAKRYLSQVGSRLKSEGVDVESFIGDGSASDVILNLATERGAGLIAMSTHGRGGLGRLVFGSVADAVLRHSGVPVLLIRSQEK